MDGQYPQETDQGDQFGGAADIIRSMQGEGIAMPQPVDPIQLSRSMGLGSIGGITGDEGYAKALGAAQSQYQHAASQAMMQAAKAKPVSPEAQFYASIGDMAKAVVLQKSKGPSLFQHGEEYDFGETLGLFAIAPSGTMPVVDVNGNIMKANVSEYAWKSGIRSVPFVGGDQNAVLYRQTLQKSGEVFKALDDLEKVYHENFAYIGKLNPSALATRAEQLETQVLLGATSLLTGTKSLGGGTSNTDIEMLQRIVPKAASTYVSNMKGNELERLKYLREMLKDHLMRASESNGLTLRSLKSKNKGKQVIPPGAIMPH